MRKYKFYKRNSELACEISEDNVTYFLNYKDAKIQLLNISKRYFKSVVADNYKATFSDGNVEIIVEDFNNILLKYASYGGYKLIECIKNAMKKRTKNMLVKKLEKTTSSVLCAAGVLTLLAFNSEHVLLGEEDFSNAEVIPIEMPIFEEKNVFSNAPTVVNLNELEKEADAIISSYNKNIELGTENFEEVEKPIIQDKNENFVGYVELECKERGDSNDVMYVEENYGDLIEANANIYGISHNFVTGYLTQESHGLEENKDNLMQIVFSSHAKPDGDSDEIKHAYNFATGKIEYFVLTYHPEKYRNEDGTYKCTVYTEESLKDPGTNIRCGVAILASYYQTYSKNNPFVALACYNQGPGTVKGFLRMAARDNGVSVDDILENPLDLSFLPYMHNSSIADPYYIENVVQYIANSEDGFYMSREEDGAIIVNRICVTKTPVKTK